MEVEEHNENGSIVFLLSGEIRGIESVQFSKQVETYRKLDCTRIIFNLSAVTFIDSTAMGAFIYLKKTMGKSGHNVLLRGPRAKIQELFRYCGLDGLFEIESTAEELQKMLSEHPKPQ